MTCGTEQDQYLTYFGTYGYKKETMHKNVYGNPKELKFENRKYYVPEDYEFYLTNVYGNYMTPPPVENRIPEHGGSRIDFGKYENIQLVNGEISY